jgi:pilus assembly protein FimV
MRGKKEKTNEETLDSEENETIALSTNELDDILSEAEIVQEKPSKKAQKASKEAPETVEEEIDIPVTEEEFDITGEIDELTPEDLENIELEESEIESFSRELEEELGDEIKLPEDQLEEEVEVVTDEELGEELESIDVDELSLGAAQEGSNEEVVDIDALLETEGEGIDLESLDLGAEPGGEELEEPPILGEEEPEVALEADEAFKEAGIEVVEDESVSLDEIDLENIEEFAVGEELPTEGEQAGELGLEELADVESVEEGEVEDLEGEESLEDLGSIEELSAEETLEDLGDVEELSTEETLEDLGNVEELNAEELPEESSIGELELSEEEEKILSEDFDLTAGIDEEEEVVTVTGDELETLGGEESSDTSRKGGSVVDAALLNDITTILKFMDTLLGDLPDEKIKEFAQSEYFPLYKEVFEKLNLT